VNKPLVYILDDDQELSSIIKRRFIGMECSAFCFHDSTLFLDALYKKKPNLLIIDLNINENTSGFDIIKIVRSEKKINVPILIMSGSKNFNDIAHGIELGAQDFIAKPPLKLEFEEVVSRYLHLNQKITTIQPAVMTTTSPSKSNIKLEFQLKIEEIHPTGFSLLSDHLVKKGASFYIKGNELKQITPSCESIFVTLIHSSIKVINEKKYYQLQVEVDITQDIALNEMRYFLDSKSK